MDHNVTIVVILAVGFAVASLLGYIAQRLKLPSILGYLLAGYLIGPHFPGFSADLSVAQQLAEVGVVLMLFGVGLHFKLQDLINVRHIALPGAIGQTVVAAVAGTAFMFFMGLPFATSVIIGLAISVASTVVLVRLLTDNTLLTTQEGHIAVGWLIVEDIVTVAILILLPMFADFFHGEQLSISHIFTAIAFILGKFVILAPALYLYGHKIVGYVLTNVARLRSQELFTLTILALAFSIATAASFLFGASLALGAFVAGMIIGQTDVRHQAVANSLPLQDVFAVIFFLSIGMLFNPFVIPEHFLLFLGVLAIILLVKPLTAFFLVRGFGLSTKIALTVAVALGQIGEFSFILTQAAMQLGLVTGVAFEILVACSLISIALNPIFFQFMSFIEKVYFKPKALRDFRAKRLTEHHEKISHVFEAQITERPKVVVVGFGPVGQAVTQVLENCNIEPIIIEQNIDVVGKVKKERRQIIYGDATQSDILEAASIAKAKLLVITVPQTATGLSIVKSTRFVNPSIDIISCVQYISEEPLMQELHVNYICSEEQTLRQFTRAVIRLVQ